MSNFKLSDRSISKLDGVNVDLRNIVIRAIQLSKVDFGVSSGLRTVEEQQKLYDDGNSPILNSYHLTGSAVDVFAWVDGAISWEWKYYEAINDAFQAAALELNKEVEWGGEWRSKDGVHFQVER